MERTKKRQRKMLIRALRYILGGAIGIVFCCYEFIVVNCEIDTIFHIGGTFLWRNYIIGIVVIIGILFLFLVFVMFIHCGSEGLKRAKKERRRK